MNLPKRTNLSREIIKRQDVIDFLNSNKPLNYLFDMPFNLPLARIELYKRTYFGIGNTECYKINLKNNNQLYLKMEYLNSMGNTHYSRFWLIYLFLCEAFGIISPNKTKILEVTSGSSGIALARAANIFQYFTTIIVPNILPQTRTSPMNNKYVNVISVPGYIPECIDKLRVLNKETIYFATNHSEEKSDTIIKVFSRIAHEIINEHIDPDYSIIALGNGTSTLAIAKTLKLHNPNTQVWTYKPDFERKPDDIVFGLIVPNIDFRHLKPALSYVDKVLFTTGVDLSEIKNYFQFDTEISNLGFSSLYGIYFAIDLAKSVQEKKILTLGYDKIDRY
ncbi:MAG: PLP-dependent lyase/thiolase [Candidatus Cloacimonetes bacterium]|nr:PLP-dependent lyase/thiolase [Candidatus Cloacimonadota bacterium]MCF8306306.1 PLP-dependent lyase/thiolase [Ignavibacteriales bacterium]MCF8316027.1 PLP-dependent lyase/thiolase [Ignavibacteriales bacterium]MCF8437621.1 PLP-dependent lyase/thiolase [Ignavibacteriales bacterium]